ncbi:UNVERIFIED_ORG: hypothetical protein FHR35_004629 [Microbispora rosea subsp. rosea]
MRTARGVRPPPRDLGDIPYWGVELMEAGPGVRREEALAGAALVLPGELRARLDAVA